MIRTIAGIIMGMAVSASVAFAGPRDLAEALRLADMGEILRQESLADSMSLSEDFPVSKAAWARMLERIHEPARMRDTLIEAFVDELDGQDTASLEAFFTSDMGARIIALEIEARAAISDDAIEDAAMDRLRRLRGQGDALLEYSAAFIEANDLVQVNMAGMLNASLAFFAGLAEGGLLADPEMALAQLRAQEDESRTETRDWLDAFLVLAHGPLTDEERAAYLAISRTPEGAALNQALFQAYDAVFNRISFSMGLALAAASSVEDL